MAQVSILGGLLCTPLLCYTPYHRFGVLLPCRPLWTHSKCGGDIMFDERQQVKNRPVWGRGERRRAAPSMFLGKRFAGEPRSDAANLGSYSEDTGSGVSADEGADARQGIRRAAETCSTGSGAKEFWNWTRSGEQTRFWKESAGSCQGIVRWCHRVWGQRGAAGEVRTWQRGAAEIQVHSPTTGEAASAADGGTDAISR